MAPPREKPPVTPTGPFAARLPSRPTTDEGTARTPDTATRRSVLLAGGFAALASAIGTSATGRIALAKDDEAGGVTAKDGKKSDAKDRGKTDGSKRDGSKTDNDDDDDDESLAEKAAERFPQPVAAGTLLHRTVLEPLESQPVLGHVAAIVRAGDGTINVVVSYGGFFGARPIAVPLDAMTLLGDDMEIVDFTPAQLRGFPTFDRAGTTPVPPDQVLRVGLSRPSH